MERSLTDEEINQVQEKVRREVENTTKNVKRNESSSQPELMRRDSIQTLILNV